MGLTVLEAEIYTHLLKDSPLTGYGVAKALGKPTANVYKAIESLADKGAVVVDDGGTRVCRPVEVKDFLSRLERDFRRHKREAQRSLGRLPGPGEDTPSFVPDSRRRCSSTRGSAPQRPNSMGSPRICAARSCVVKPNSKAWTQSSRTR